MRTVLVYVPALGAVAAALFLGFPEWFREAPEEAAAAAQSKLAPPVVVARVVKSPFRDQLEALGTVRANESVEITANRADHVAAIYFEDGQVVRKGDLLVEMHVAEEAALLEEASAVRDQRLHSQKRAQELFDKKMMSEREFEGSRSLLAAAEARVISLKAAISDRVVRAPFAGRLGLRRVSVGAYLQPSTVITTLDDLTVVKLDFTIPETWLSQVARDMKILATSKAWPKLAFEGAVVTVDSRLDSRTRSVTVRALLPNGEGKLRPGMLLMVEIDRGEAPVMQVPEEALIPIGSEHFAYRIDAKMMATRVQVAVGRRRAGTVEILSGLEVGDQIVVEGIVRVRPGSEVDVVKVVNPEAVAGGKR